MRVKIVNNLLTQHQKLIKNPSAITRRGENLIYSEPKTPDQSFFFRATAAAMAAIMATTQ